MLNHTKRATVDENDNAHEEEHGHADKEEHGHADEEEHGHISGEEQEVCDPFPRLQRVITHTSGCTLIWPCMI